MQYIPLRSRVADEASFAEEEGRSACCSAPVTGKRAEHQPVEWHDAVQRAWWYRLSSFSYCVVGAATVARPEPLIACAPFFPFRVMGAAVFVNGLLSFMGDVVTWGYESHWKTADVLLATTNSALQAIIVLMSLAGFAHFPPASPALLGVSLVVALFCKHRGTEARERGECDSYLWWHTAWHLTLPLGALIASQILLETPPDDRWSETSRSETSRSER